MLAKFFKSISSKNSTIQVGELNRISLYMDHDADPKRIEEFLKKNEDLDLYFLGGVDKEKEGRASDLDIVEKGYIALDFDIRNDLKDSQPDITDERIKEIGLEIGEALKKKGKSLAKWRWIVYSGNGIHVYLTDPAIKITPKAYASAMKLLMSEVDRALEKYKCDPACKNIARIFRVPDSYNNKHGNHKHVEILDSQSTDCGIMEKMEAMAKFQDEEDAKSPGILQTKIEPLKEGMNLWEAVCNIDCKQGLIMLSGKDCIKNEILSFRNRPQGGEHVDFNSQPADCWIDAEGFIGSGSDAGPNLVKFVAWYNKDKTAKERMRLAARDLKVVFKDILPKSAMAQKDEDFEPPLEFIEWEDAVQHAKDTFDDKPDYITYGCDFLDKKLGGIFAKELVLLGGITGTGKTTLAMQVAENEAKRGGKVVIAALEEDPKTRAERTILQKINSSRSPEDRIPFVKFKIKDPDYMPSREEFIKAAEELGIHNMTFVAGGQAMSMPKLEQIYQRGASLIILDHLHFFSVYSEGRSSRADMLEQAMQEIKRLTIKYNTRTVLVAHFQKLDEAKKPTMSSFKDSISIPQTADTIILLWRDRGDKVDPLKQAETEFIVPKNRIDVAAFVATAQYDIGTNTYMDEVQFSEGTENTDSPSTMGMKF